MPDVASQIRALILSGEFAQGERLTELGLAERWGVSQGTMRAALRLLQGEGLVVSQPRRGTTVVSLGREDIVEISTLRNLLESYAARAAAERMTDDGRRRLQLVFDQMVAAAEAGRRKRLLDLDFEFHKNVFAICGHRRLEAIYLSLEAQSRLFMSMTEYLHHDLTDSIRHHRPLFDALMAGDADRAFELSSRHSDSDLSELVSQLFSGLAVS